MRELRHYIKKSFLLSVGLFLASLSSYAQSNQLFTILPATQLSSMKMSATQREVADKTLKDPFLKKMDVVQIGDIAKLQKNSEITFTLPRYGKVTAKAIKIEAVSSTNFKWIGEVGSGGGYMIVYNRDGNVSGHITVGSNSYQIKAMGGNISLLAEIDTQKMGSTFCSGTGSNKTNPNTKPSTTPNTNKLDFCVNKIRVLVVYTQRAVNAVGLQSINERVQISLDQFNTAYSISGVSNPQAQLELAGIEQTTFTETTGGGAIDDKAKEELDIQRLPNATEARRIATNADIVVCLVDAGYTYSKGIARAINAQYADGFAICEVRLIPDQPVFPHEIGHLLGGRHHNDPAPDDAHGYVYFANGQTYCTLVR